MTRTTLITSTALLFLLAACSGDDTDTPPQDEAAEEMPTANAPEESSTDMEIPAGMPRSESVSGASVYFIMPTDGATVTNPIDIEFGIEGMHIAPAGVEEPYSGHHHLLIDTELPALNQPIPADDNHIHFGDGSTSTQITLEPGEHTLLLLLGDHLHVPHDPAVTSPTITITVE